MKLSTTVRQFLKLVRVEGHLRTVRDSYAHYKPLLFRRLRRQPSTTLDYQLRKHLPLFRVKNLLNLR